LRRGSNPVAECIGHGDGADPFQAANPCRTEWRGQLQVDGWIIAREPEPLGAGIHGLGIHAGAGREELTTDVDSATEYPGPRTGAHPDLELERCHRLLQLAEMLNDLVAVAPVLHLGEHVSLNDEERSDPVAQRSAHLRLDGQDVPVAGRADNRGPDPWHVMRDPGREGIWRQAYLLEGVVRDEDAFPATLEPQMRRSWQPGRIDLHHLDPGARDGEHPA